VGFLGRGVPLPSRLGSLGERRELPQQGPGRSPGRQRILGIFQGLRSLLVETVHYGVWSIWYGIVMCEKLLDVPSAN